MVSSVTRYTCLRFISSAIFNSYCVLFGAMDLKLKDLTKVVPDVLKTRRIILRGFACINRSRPHAESRD